MRYVLTQVFHKWISTALSDSCSVSSSTVQAVDKCPDTEEKWSEAAVRKNCSAHASQCNEPERLVYHCVINTYANQTLEVCAYYWTIVLGSCTEYTESGNRIQQSTINCTHFAQTPCPSGYISTHAYKYHDCYKVAKANRRREEEQTTAKNDILARKNSTQNGKSGDKNMSAEDSHVTVIYTIIAAFVIVIVIAIIMYKCFRQRQDSQRNDDHPRVEYRAPGGDVEENN